MSMSGIPVASEIEAHRQTGVHVLDQPPPPETLTTKDTYTGNNTANRAIPHGLGVTPKCVLIAASNGSLWSIFDGFAFVNPTSSLPVTAMDSMNFYVGNATNYPTTANSSVVDYRWVAIK